MLEREISLASVLGEILRYWRRVLVILAIGMIMGGIFGIRQNNTAEPEALPIPELSFLSKEKVRLLQVMEQEYQEELEKYEGSPIIAMEDNAVWCGMLWYETMNKSIAMSIIADQLYGEEGDIEKFSQIMPDITGNTLKEIVNMPESNDDSVIYIRILSEDKETCLSLMEQVKLSLHEFITMDSIELTLVYENCSNEGRDFVRALQRQRYEQMGSLQRNIENLKAQMSEDELLYYRNGDSDSVVEVRQQEANGITVSYKMIMIGGVAGVFIYACWIGLRYLMNNKVKAEDDIQALYGIPEIQMIVQWQNYKWTLDKQLLKWRCRLSRLKDPSEAINIASRQILTLTEETQTPIAVWEWIREEEKADVVQTFCESLKNAGKECVVVNFVMDSAEKLQKVTGIKMVVLIIQEKVVSYQEIFKAINYLNRQGVQILGTIRLV